MNLLLRSLYIDWEFINLRIPGKLSFIIKKYLLLFKNFILGFKIGVSHIRVFGQNYYYYDRFGIAFLQSVIIESHFLSKYIKPKATIVDVGGHVGEFHLFCKRILKASRIISIEPIKESFLLLEKNASEKPYQYAVSTKNQVTMYIPNTTIMSSIIKSEDNSQEEVSMGLQLDNFDEVKNLDAIDLLKIDVEGAEYDVIKTAKQTIKKTLYIFVEASLKRPSLGNLEEVMSLIKKTCPKAKIVYKGNPFIVSGKEVCVNVLIKCT